MKPTHILVVKTESGSFVSINTQDLKVVRINPGKETATLVTSSTSTEMTCMTKSRLDRLSKELNDRYNLLHLPSMQARNSNRDNTLFVVEQGDIKVYIWPKALFTITKRGQKVHVKAFKTELTVVDENNRVTAEDLVRFHGLVKVNTR